MKLKLDLDELAEEFFRNTRLIGIVAPIKDYQLCWQLNQLLTIDFRNNNDIEIQLKRKKRDYYFAIFQYCEATNSLNHYLYNNQFDGEYLLPEFRHLDFLYLLKGDVVSDEFFHQLMDTIRKINGVQLVMELAHEKIKNKGHMIF
ncbi:MAG: IPExxxVDY family protein [Chitinophagaceae bacterium]|nr:IPExxxVDY family protein [Chitinophagaceae bacterium]